LRLSSASRFDWRDCRHRFPGTQTATRKANVPPLRRRTRIGHLDIAVTAIRYLPLRRTVSIEIVFPSINHEREFLAHEAAQSLPHGIIESDILVLRTDRTTHILDGFCQLHLIQGAFVEVDKVDGVHKLDWGDTGGIGVRFTAMLLCDIAEDVIRLGHGLLHPLVDGILVLVKPLF